ncbi:putative major facilitator superfamily transporter [Caenibius tardaugens NBRC 16725]|uniref:Putative major facilitator superfamily transporter n=1 Tax=Caenibius tardaugens NBRC 16725 TaxID=1219035 RepID=U2ZXD5_9SPHN|nr:MFS transporter [Caenibius tardaugens]AZI35664.1 MFS transporter [Caenibius tardaugens NBRC 16725]GAD50049.1 putative major facilitator superfamily transporter [Caenibius tardaugens NBRC 16725]
MKHEEQADLPYLRKVVGASMAGTVVEWYEFFLYGTAATLVFGKLFFPQTGNELDGVIAAFATYAVGFIARPLGGIVFGHIGDRIGRKSLLQFSLVLIGVSTFLMGCLPTFSTIGYWAPVLLVLLRFIQGFALGGEWGGAVLLVAENSPNHSRAFWGSFPQAGVPLGNLLATVVLLVLSAFLSEDAFLSWGWRVGFWLSVVIVAVGYYIRTQVTDSPIFEAAKAEAEERAHEGYGLVEVFRRYPRGVFTAMGLRVGENILYYMVVTFSITYLAYIGVDTTDILALLFCAHILHVLIIPVFGALADRIGRKPVYMLGAALTMLWPFLAFPMFMTERLPIILGAIFIGMIVHALMYAAQPALMAEMFPTRMRYSGVSLGYQVTAIFAGSWAPLIGTALLREYNHWTPIAFYILGAGFISLVSAIVMRESRGVSLLAIDREDRQRSMQAAAG